MYVSNTNTKPWSQNNQKPLPCPSVFPLSVCKNTTGTSGSSSMNSLIYNYGFVSVYIKNYILKTKTLLHMEFLSKTNTSNDAKAKYIDNIFHNSTWWMITRSPGANPP